MKIAWAQLNFHIGNFDANSSKIIEQINHAKIQGADLIVFPELSLCGYPPLDFLESNQFIQECMGAIENIANNCDGIAAIVGAPALNNSETGKKLFNAAYFLANKKVEKVIKKSLLPNYDIFDEYRYFEPNKSFEIIEYKGKKIALTICEDLWDEQDETFTPLNHSKMYTISPMKELMKFNPDLMVNIAASPFSYIQNQTRWKVLQRNVLKYQLPLLYVNHCGAQTELVFDGGSCGLNARGELIAKAPFFNENFQIVNFEDNSRVIENQIELISKNELIIDALVCGIGDYFSKQNFKKAILGLSGGIDSALTLVLAVKALGKDNVMAVLLPSAFSSDHSINDALKLVDNLGCKHQIIPIEDNFQSILKTLEPSFNGTPFSLAEENIQARLRGVILMAMSNKFGYILLNTSNKSEMAVGYGTLYGDMCGGLAVIGDVYKTEVYELCNFINLKEEIIPINTIVKPPSAELRPNQKDSDSLPEYDILDKILYQYIENKKSVQEIFQLGFDIELVKRVVNMVNKNEYKRKQAAPVIRVSPKAFGMGRRMPIVANYNC
ncbi:MAG TPA: NAD+ synthase [Bacteroidia bacterium]|nr:NAD+ synthase [Bacteroidia bacterium]